MMQRLPGGKCFEHGDYTEMRCPRCPEMTIAYTVSPSYEDGFRAGQLAMRERAAKVHEPSCLCTHPCDQYFSWPSDCHKKAASVIRALPIAGPEPK